MNARALLLLVLLVPACQVSEIPEVPVPVELPEEFEQTGAAPLPDRWWVTFDDPALTDLIDRALTSNFTLKEAWDRLAQARAIAVKAGVPLKPILDYTAGLGGSWTRAKIELPGGGKDRVSDSAADLSLGLAASYEVDLWGRLAATRDAAELDVLATREDLAALAMTLSAQIASTWYALVEQHDQIDLLADQIRTNEQVLELITLRFRQGQAPASDVFRQRQLAEARRGDQVLAEAAAKVLENQLAVLVGRAPETPMPGEAETLVPLPPLPETGLPLELVGRRPDVRSAWLRVRAADRRVASAIADLYPRLALTARVNTGGDRVADLFDDWFATLAANLVGPIFDGGRRDAEIDRTRAVASERLNRYGQTILDALEEVESSLVRETRRQDYIASLRLQLVLSRSALDSIRDRYMSGAAAYLDVLEALGTSQNLQRNILSSRRELLLDRIDLCRALGGGFPVAPPANPESLPEQVASRPDPARPETTPGFEKRN